MVGAFGSYRQRTLTYFVRERYHCTADLLFDGFGLSCLDYVELDSD